MMKTDPDSVARNLHTLKAIQSKLESLPLKNQTAVVMSVDLADIYESCLEYVELIEQLNTLPPNLSSETAKVFIQIESVLSHIQWHTQSVKGNLSQFIHHVYRQLEKEEEQERTIGF
ncbi:hypothetical protein HYR99_20000 [Candidatus Poribacteria bacterium]|nr:hypothetical protein [Candidatus Poribacteria bacterium]